MRGALRCRLPTAAAAVVAAAAAAVAALAAVRPAAAALPRARPPVGTVVGGGGDAAADAAALDGVGVVRTGDGGSPPGPPAPGLHFLVDGVLSATIPPRAVLHSFGSATDALTVLFVPAAAGEAVTGTRFEGLDAAVCTAAGVEVKPAAPGTVAASGGGGGGGGVIPAGASNMTLTMDFDGRVGVTDWALVVDTVDAAGVARAYTCGGTVRVCGLSLTDAATGAVLSGDGGAGLSLGTYADVLAAGTVRLGVRAVACAAGAAAAPALDEVSLTTRDVGCEEDLRVFPQPDACPTVADDVRPGCSFAFTTAGDGLLLRPAAYRTGAGKVDASIVWPAAALDGEAFETGLSITVATVPVPPPVLLPASLDGMDVYGGELLPVPAFNAPTYGDELGTCTLSVADRTAPLLRDECTLGAAEQSLVFLSAGGPAFSVHNRTDVTCTTAAGGATRGVAALRPAAVSVSFGDGTLAVRALANRTAFLATAAAAGDAALALTLRYAAYAPDRFSAAKSAAVAAAVAAAAALPADAVAVVDVAPGPPAGGGCDQTLLLRAPAGADVAATERAVAGVVASGALAASVRLPSSGVALVSLGAARGGGGGGPAGDAAVDSVSGPSGLAVGLIVGAVAAAAAVLALVAAAVKASRASAAAESSFSSSSGPLGVPAASVGAAAGGGDILRDVYGRSGEPHRLAGGVAAGAAAAVVPSGRSDVASSTYSV